jgi:hypothetical protein
LDLLQASSGANRLIAQEQADFSMQKLCVIKVNNEKDWDKIT